MKQYHKKAYFFRANGANTQTDCSGVLYGDIGAAFFIKLLLVYLCITAFVLLALLLFFKNFPMVDLSPQAITDIPESLRIYDSDDELALTASGSQRRIFIELSQLPPDVKNLFSTMIAVFSPKCKKRNPPEAFFLRGRVHLSYRPASFFRS